jgi:phenylacetaldehyde dehydrogenase
MTDTPSRDVAVPPLRELIDGAWADPTVDLGAELHNPNTGEPIGRQLGSSAESLEAAIAAADREHNRTDADAWGRRSVADRAAILMSVADALDAAADRIADLESLGTGAIRRMTGMLTVINGGSFRLAAMQLQSGWTKSGITAQSGNEVEVHRLPFGPALCLVPWNAPAPMAAHKVANALAAGCPTILKPSEYAPLGTSVLAEVIAGALDAAGVAPGTFQLIQGGPKQGAVAVQDPRIKAVSFTGGLGGGRAIAAACAYDMKPAQLELGGNNPVVVLPDADPDFAAQGAVDLLTQLNGQWCRALGRLIVHESIADDVVERIVAKLAGLRLGDSLSLETDLGPMVHAEHLALLQGRIAELVGLGGTAHAPATLPDLPGYFLSPTLVTGVSSADALHEIFGPVATVHTFSTDAEAVALANGTPYGLEGYVFGGDTDRAMAVARQVHAGGVKVNGSTVLSLDIMAPRPAWGLSGYAEEGTAETFQFFCNTRVVGVEGVLAGQLGG